MARVRVRRDPHYGLPLIFCPECETPAIRRRHPLSHRWQRIKQLLVSIVAMLIQLALIATFLSAITAICVGLGDEITRGSYPTDRGVIIVVATLLLGAVPIALGTWLTAGLHHWRRWVVWLVFTLIIASFVSVDTVIGPWMSRWLADLGADIHIDRYRWDRFTARLALLALTMTVALLGLLTGRATLRGYAFARRRLWRVRRRRLRARRTA